MITKDVSVNYYDWNRVEQNYNLVKTVKWCERTMSTSKFKKSELGNQNYDLFRYINLVTTAL